MKQFAIIGITIWCLLFLGEQPVFCQYIAKEANLPQSDSNRTSKKDFYLHFPNIEKLPFFYDQKKLDLISSLEKKEDWAKLKKYLEEYISNFGMENFQRNSSLLWKMAQLCEKQSHFEEAKFYYRMAIRHTPTDVELIRQYYDNLVTLEKDYYVPIQYYYDLVDYRAQVDTLKPPRGVLINMGGSINSPYEDYGPALSGDDNSLIFTSQRNRSMRGGQEVVNEDIYIVFRNASGSWGEAEPVDGINSPYNEGSPCISFDGSKIYFVRCEDPDGHGNCDIYEADRQPDHTFGNVRNMGKAINSEYWDSHPAISKSGDTLYFASDRVGGFGDTDIWFSVKGRNGKWSPARNLGPVINTAQHDLSPFIHPVHDVLYFSSNGHILNFGNFDIYKAYRDNGRWKEPKNIGPLVNGQGDEYYFTIDSRSEYLYYARSEIENIEDFDLYSFPLPMEAQPLAVTVFKGELKDSVTGNPFAGLVSVIDLENGIEVAPKFLRPDGSFEFDLIADSRYLLIITGEDFFRIEQEIFLTGDTTLSIAAPSINTVKLGFTSIEFGSNSWDILPEMRPDLDRLLNFLLDNPQFELTISGHTDSRGNMEANQHLSQRRADAIKEYLIKKGGIEPIRINSIGYGSSKPIVKNEKTDEDRKINRRVEFDLNRPEKKPEPDKSHLRSGF